MKRGHERKVTHVINKMDQSNNKTEKTKPIQSMFSDVDIEDMEEDGISDDEDSNTFDFQAFRNQHRSKDPNATTSFRLTKEGIELITTDDESSDISDEHSLDSKHRH